MTTDGGVPKLRKVDRCSACGTLGHRRTWAACPQYLARLPDAARAAHATARAQHKRSPLATRPRANGKGYTLDFSWAAKRPRVSATVTARCAVFAPGDEVAPTHYPAGDARALWRGVVCALVDGHVTVRWDGFAFAIPHRWDELRHLDTRRAAAAQEVLARHAELE